VVLGGGKASLFLAVDRLGSITGSGGIGMSYRMPGSDQKIEQRRVQDIRTRLGGKDGGAN